jgi:branched-chain amino acid transport system ATP-binding protein
VQRTAQFILELNKETSIIVVEHDMQFVRQIAKNVTVFHQGKILIEDSMQNVQQNRMVRDIYLGKG